MANRSRITCIKKDDRYSPYEAIQEVGGVSKDGPWTISQKRCIELIDGGWQFYVNELGHDVDVIVAKSRFGNRYIRTVSDRDTPDNLLSLPECP
jgi:hypothetical protein